METLEERIKRLELELLGHVSSPHYFSGRQDEEVSKLAKRLGISSKDRMNESCDRLKEEGK